MGTIRARLGAAGWRGNGVAAIQLHDNTADVALAFLGHHLDVQYDIAAGSWRTEALWLFGDKSQPCPLTLTLREPNVTRTEALTAANYLPDVLVLRARICRLIYSKEAAGAQADVRELVDWVVQPEGWNRHRLFAALGWMLAERWSIGDTLVAAETDEDELLMTVKHALRINATTFLEKRQGNLVRARREND